MKRNYKTRPICTPYRENLREPMHEFPCFLLKFSGAFFGPARRNAQFPGNLLGGVSSFGQRLRQILCGNSLPSSWQLWQTHATATGCPTRRDPAHKGRAADCLPPGGNTAARPLFFFMALRGKGYSAFVDLCVCICACDAGAMRHMSV